MINSILFVTGTRADFGKIKPLLSILKARTEIKISILVTGMHLQTKYGRTIREVEKSNLGEVFTFLNRSGDDLPELILSKTIIGMSDYIKEIRPELIVVHGDRVESLAAAIVGNFNNIHVLHIEGGEVSSTLDEVMRHCITKLAHLHCVSNSSAKNRVLAMGEDPNSVFTIGSPEVDIMFSDDLPLKKTVLEHYEISFSEYAIFLYHPVSNELSNLNHNLEVLRKILISAKYNFICIYPNNDMGSFEILNMLNSIKDFSHLKLLPSMRFEYFLTALKNAKFILGNSSVGVREAPVFGLPSINVGSRQLSRSTAPTIINVDYEFESILESINLVSRIPRVPNFGFGEGGTAEKFLEIITSDSIDKIPIQKKFLDNFI